MPLQETLNLLHRELREIGGRDIVLEIALREQDFRNDGMPRANAKPEHPGVILSFTAKGGAMRFPCGTFDRWQDNLRGIALSLEALRKIDRYGVTRHAEQYAGWKQIAGTPSTEQPMDRDMALGILRDLAPAARRDEPLERLVRWAKAGAHPDRHAGDRTKWDNVEQAARVLGLQS